MRGIAPRLISLVILGYMSFAGTLAATAQTPLAEVPPRPEPTREWLPYPVPESAPLPPATITNPEDSWIPMVWAGHPEWSTPVVLSTNTNHAWFPSIITDHLGRVHVFYPSGTAPKAPLQSGKDLVMYTMWDGHQWLEPNDIINPGTGGYPTRPRAAIDQRGNVHLLVRQWTRIGHTWSPLETAYKPLSWAPLRPICSRGGAYYADIAIDSQGRLHAIWNEVTQDPPGEESWICPNCMDIFYRSSSDGGRTWTAPINLSRSPGGSNKPQIAVDAQDVIHVIWEEGIDYTGRGRPQSVAYRRSLDSGATWEPIHHVVNGTGATTQAATGPLEPTPLPSHRPWFSPTVYLDEPGAPAQPALAVDAAQGTMLMVWRTIPGNPLYYSVSPNGGATWLNPQPIPGLWSRPYEDTPFDIYDLAVDSLGHIHLVAVGRPTDDAGPRSALGLYHLVWNGRNWSQPEPIVRQEGFYPEWPQIAISGGNQLHVAWFVRGEEDRYSEEGRYVILYAAKTVEAPAITPLPPLTPTPTTPPTERAAPTAAHTPPPTMPAGAIVLGEPPQYDGEAEAVINLLIAVAPVLLLTGMLLMMRRAQRR